MSRLEQKKLAWLCLSAFLFLQVAVTAHACPTIANGGTVASPGIVPMAHPCSGADQEHPKLCEQHCVHDSQSVDTQPHSAVSAPLLVLLAVVIQSDIHFAAGPSVRDALLATAVDPPPLVRFGVLRI